MFREIRLKDRVVDDEKAFEIIKKGSYGVLSTIGEDGYPYGIPLNYTYFNNCICFHCAQEGHKLENIDYNRKVSFCVVTKSDVLGNEFDTDYESAIAFGKATVIMDEKTEVVKQPGLLLQLPILSGCLGFGFPGFALPIYRTNLHQI